MADKVAGGDFVRIEFTGKHKAGGAVFDTTDEKRAKEAGIHHEGAPYGPVLVVVGRGMMIKGLEDALEGMAVGEHKTVEVPPEKAYGLRNPALVRVMPLLEFRKRDINPYPGMVVDLDGAPALVRSVTSGRVMVDLNHSLAGEALVFDVKVAEKVDGLEKRAKALLDNSRLPSGKVKAEGGKLEVSMPATEEPGDASYFVSKTSFIRAVKELLPEVSEIGFTEKFSVKPKKEAEG